jgi:hypothetical protein
MWEIFMGNRGEREERGKREGREREEGRDLIRVCEVCIILLSSLVSLLSSLFFSSSLLPSSLSSFSLPGVAKLDYMNPRITASPRRPQGGGAMP